jgi:hypothetical protein
MLAMDEVIANWRRVLSNGLAAAGCFKISIPLKVDHATYQERVTGIITSGMAAPP